jgi:hypothetical protein
MGDYRDVIGNHDFSFQDKGFDERRSDSRPSEGESAIFLEILPRSGR